MKRKLRVAVWVFALAAACGHSPPPPPPPPAPLPEPPTLPLEVELVAGDRLNPDDMGRPLPTAVRVYQLRSAVKLERADFSAVYRHAKESLGEDLLQADDVTLSPGEKVTRRLDRDKAARAVAIVGVFRRPSGASWRALVELGPASQRTDLRFLLDEYRVERR